MWSLLTLGLLSSTQGTGTLPDRSAADVASLLESLAHPFTSRSSTGDWGTIRHGSAVVEVGMSTSYGPEGSKGPSWISAIDLTMELALPREVQTADRSYRGTFLEETTPTLIVSHVGRTVSLMKHFVLPKSETREALRAALNEFWKTGQGFARSNGARFVTAPVKDWSKERLPDNLPLAWSDPVSLQRATSSWGWQWRKGWGGSSNGWIFPIEVDGAQLWLHQNVNSSLPRDASVYVQRRIPLPKSVNAQSWVESTGKSFKWAQFSPFYENSVSAQTEIDLRKPLTLGELRRRIKEFAERAAAVERSP